FDVFTLSSIKEGLPYSLLEALAAGVPAVITNAGGMPEVAQQCPAVAVVPMRNSKALAEALQTKGLGAREQALGKIPCVPFTIGQMTLETERIYPLP
ncbi:MAG: glycosyltransferase, partial [Candidatus Kerfeldbacteria bacterium]|nr:glycosyltransferase [Candidatus Kerfeldbacteria bacterium]